MTEGSATSLKSDTPHLKSQEILKYLASLLPCILDYYDVILLNIIRITSHQSQSAFAL